MTIKEIEGRRGEKTTAAAHSGSQDCQARSKPGLPAIEEKLGVSMRVLLGKIRVDKMVGPGRVRSYLLSPPFPRARGLAHRMDNDAATDVDEDDTDVDSSSEAPLRCAAASSSTEAAPAPLPAVSADAAASSSAEAAPAPLPAVSADAAASSSTEAATATLPAVLAGQAGGPIWEVMLSGSFQSYEEPSVHVQLEAALTALEDSAEVVVRGAAYVVHLKQTPMRQVQKADPTKCREVRRVGAQDALRAPGPSSAADDGGGAPAKRKRTEVADGAAAASSAASATAATAAAPAWRLLTLDPRWGASPAAQAETVGLAALLSPGELRGATELHLHNFMIDLDWMCEECPGLAAFCAASSTAGIHVPARRVRVFHGDGRPPRSAAVGGGRVDCFAPPHEQYGTHHSKVPHAPAPSPRQACAEATAPISPHTFLALGSPLQDRSAPGAFRLTRAPVPPRLPAPSSPLPGHHHRPPRATECARDHRQFHLPRLEVQDQRGRLLPLRAARRRRARRARRRLRLGLARVLCRAQGHRPPPAARVEGRQRAARADRRGVRGVGSAAARLARGLRLLGRTRAARGIGARHLGRRVGGAARRPRAAPVGQLQHRPDLAPCCDRHRRPRPGRPEGEGAPQQPLLRPPQAASAGRLRRPPPLL